MMAEPEVIDPKVLRDLKIKTGVVRRMGKEKVSYEKETVKMQEKLDKMKANDPDDYNIKKQQEILEESRCMVPDCQRRLVAAWDELHKLTEEEKSEGLRCREEYTTACTVLAEFRQVANR